jgi:polyribonucleotide nucleotidyltransferase
VQDAGVPMRRRVAGVAMGLVLNEDGSFVILSDIMGMEDHLGDMDFKVAGDADTITAFQMDIKVEGVTVDILRKALESARESRQHILAEMEKAQPPPREDLSPFCTRIVKYLVAGDKVGQVIGPGGALFFLTFVFRPLSC